jgi:hypothetical protein
MKWGRFAGRFAGQKIADRLKALFVAKLGERVPKGRVLTVWTSGRIR